MKALEYVIENVVIIADLIFDIVMYSLSSKHFLINYMISDKSGLGMLRCISCTRRWIVDLPIVNRIPTYL